ncbi:MULTISPECIES: salt stress protein, Slr1339 family [unclassified Microcoleus]|uniref:salt stress protein, Slr1339 family n=1 Tax=unclassified Microcoleus TaxID=2642155 RepID=UPI002FCEAB79
MESIDRLLAELKAEYQASQKLREVQSQPSVEAQPLSQPAAVPSNKTSKTTNINLYPGALEKDLAEIKAECEAQNKHQEVAAQKPLKSPKKAENKAQEVTALAPQPPEKIVQSELDIQTRRQKVRQAQVWLKNLDKNSDERYWFDQFAFKYSSRIDAAIDYLQVVDEFD